MLIKKIHMESIKRLSFMEFISNQNKYCQRRLHETTYYILALQVNFLVHFIEKGVIIFTMTDQLTSEELITRTHLLHKVTQGRVTVKQENRSVPNN